MGDSMRIVFMGMTGEFSRIPFQALLDARANVAGLIIPRPSADRDGPRWLDPSSSSPSGLPLLSSPVAPNVVHLATSAGIAILEVGSLSDPRSLAALDSLAPDLICAACFPWLLPPAWLECPSLGCLNLHPSLLPAYRGPAPLFWQFRAGEQPTGVTLHFMDEGADTGDIVSQVEVSFPDGITGLEADRLTAEAGARLVMEALAPPHPLASPPDRTFPGGRGGGLPRRPQPEAGASYQSRPSRSDLAIPISWTARRAFNFIRGAGEWGPFEIVVGGGRFRVSEALTYSPDARLGQPYRREGGELWVEFEGGVVRMTATL